MIFGEKRQGAHRGARTFGAHQAFGARAGVCGLYRRLLAARCECGGRKLAATRETRQFEPSQASAGAAAPAPRTPKVALPPREKERLRIERDFLSLCASEPSIGLAYAGALAQTVWHRDIHGQIATQLLDVLAEDATAPAAEIVRRLEESIPGAASVISGSSTHDDREPGELARFFSEELAIRDMEDLIREMNAQLKRPQDMPADDYNLMFESVVAMQKGACCGEARA